MLSRILVVDDDPALREIAAEFLSAHGYQVSTAGSGEEALSKLERGAVELLLTDDGLGEMRGVELIARAAERGLLRGTACVLMTGLLPSRVPHGTLVLEKPFETSCLLDMVAAATWESARRRAIDAGAPLA